MGPFYRVQVHRMTIVLKYPQEVYCIARAPGRRFAYAMRCAAPIAAGLLLSVALIGCKGYMDLGGWDVDAGAADAGSDAGTASDAGVVDSGEADAGSDGGCPGICAKAPAYWAGPYLVASAGAGQLPPCPYDAPGEAAWRGHADLVVPTTCEGCLCGPSTGACALPTKLTASTNPCNGGVQPIPFDAPPGWDGTCDDTNPIAAADKVKSLWVDPLTVAQESCAVIDPTGQAGPTKTSWKTDAVACHGGGWWPCGDPSAACIPTVPPGFRVCIIFNGDVQCPGVMPEFSDRQVFYADVDDQRQCTACACGAPIGSMCAAQMTVYHDNDLTCSGSTVGSVGISSAMPSCLSVNPEGQPLGSKSATSPTYISGICDEIPGVVDPDGGTATPSQPTTACCIP